jgi:hypothetical protein
MVSGVGRGRGEAWYVAVRAGPWPRGVFCPEIKVQDDMMGTEGAGAVVEVVMGREAEERVVRAGLGTGGGYESGPPWGRVGAGHDGDAVSPARPGFEERRPEEREWWKKQAALGAEGPAPKAEIVCPTVLGQPGGRRFGGDGVEAGTLRVGRSGEQIDGEVETSAKCRSCELAESALAVRRAAAERGGEGRSAGDSRIQGRGMLSSMQEVVKSMVMSCKAESDEEPCRRARVARAFGTRSRSEADPLEMRRVDAIRPMRAARAIWWQGSSWQPA